MTDIFQEVEEDLRRDRYERLAKKYGVYVIGGVLLAVAGTAGYVMWQNWHQAQQQAATQRLTEAVELASAPATAKEGAAALEQVAGSDDRSVGGLARFFEAGQKARAGDPKGAAALYLTLAVDPGLPALYRDLASLLAVQLDIKDGDPKLLAQRLEPLAADVNPWRYSARELTGLLAARTGDGARAKTLFQQLADDKGAPPGLRARAAELAAHYGKNG